VILGAHGTTLLLLLVLCFLLVVFAVRR